MTAETTTEPAATVAPLAAPLPEGQGLDQQVKPFAAMGALFIAAGAARVAMTATGYDAEIAATTSSVAFILAVVLACASRRRLMPRRMRSRYLAAIWLGATWVAGVVYMGMSMGAVSLLTLVGVSLSLAFLDAHRIDAPTEELPRFDGLLYLERWATNLGAQGKPLAGSRLRPDPELIRAGYRYTLELVPGSQTVAGALALGDQLRGGLRLHPGQEVIVEEHPTEPAPTALVTIVVLSPVKKPRVWPGAALGFDAATGSVNLGPFVDDEGIAQFGAYRRDGVFGGYIQGGQGSGKSRLIESIAMSLASSVTHPTVIWYADGQRGASSPMLMRHADWAVNEAAQFYDMLCAAEQIMIFNSEQNLLAGEVGFRPTAERPGLGIIYDECHKFLDEAVYGVLAKKIQKKLAFLAREGRKAGVFLIMASQSPTLDAFGGRGNDADTLRACLLTGNGIVLRSETNNAKQVFRIDVDPRQFPKLPGYGFHARPDDGARSAPFRGYWVTDALAKSEPGRVTWRTMLKGQAAVAGRAYACRREAAEQERAALIEKHRMIELGLYDLDREVSEQMAAAERAGTVGPREFIDGVPPVADVERFWVVMEAKQAEGELKVLAAIASGYVSPATIMTHTGYGKTHVHNILNRLKGAGRIEPTGYGKYAVKRAA